MKKEFKMNLLSSNIRHYIWALVAPALVSSGAYAATYNPVYGDAAGTGDIAIGDLSVTVGRQNNVAIGKNAKAGSQGGHNQSIAIGSGTKPGEGASALGDQSIAIGGNTEARGDSSIAIGGDDLNAASKKNISYVNSKGENTSGSIESAYKDLTGNSLKPTSYTATKSENLAIAIGVKTTAKELSLALGTFANAGEVNTVAIGSGANASLANSVAIGGGAVVDDKNKGTKQTQVEYDGITYKWAGGDRVAEGDVVSFGKKGYERQLKNISPGEVSENSTDAINGSQLHSITKDLTERVNKLHNNFKLSGDNNTNTDSQALNKDGGLNFGIKGDGTITTKAAGSDITISLSDEAKNKINNAADKTDVDTKINKIGDNTLKLSGNDGETSDQSLKKDGGLSFGVKGDGTYLTSKAVGSDVTISLTEATKKKIDEAANHDLSNLTQDGNTTVKNLAKEAIKVIDGQNTTVEEGEDNGAKTFKVNVNLDPYAKKDGSNVENPQTWRTALDVMSKAEVNTAIDKLGNNTFKLSGNTGDTDNQNLNKQGGLSFSVVGDGTYLNSKATGSEVKIELTQDTKDKIDNAANKDASNIDNPKAWRDKLDVMNKSEVNTAINEAGWTVEANTTTDGTGEYSADVKNTNKVKFIGKNLANVSGKTENDVRTITVDVQLNDTVTDNKTITVTDGKLNVLTTGLTDDGTTLTPTGNNGDALVNATTLATALNDYAFVAKANSEKSDGFKVTRNATLDFIAGDNLTVTREKDTGKFTFAVSKTPTFDNVTISNGPVLSSTGLDMKDKPITNVTNSLTNYTGDTPKKDLVNLDPNANPAVDGKTVATVDNLRNMGWIVSSDKKTDGTAGEYSDSVKNANEVKFIGKNLANVSGKTEGDVRTITVDVQLDKSITDNTTITVNDAGKLEAVTAGLTEEGGKLKSDGEPNSLVNATTLATALNDYGFIAKANSEQSDGFKVTRNATLDFIAGDNLTVTREKDTGKFTFAVSKTPTFDNVTISNGPVLSSTGLDMKDKPITNVTNGLTNYTGDTPKKDLVNLDPNANPAVDGKTVATVDNLRNMGWIVSSDKKTDGTAGEYSDSVKNANEVKFIGTNLATVSGKTDNGVRTITVDVNAQNVVNKAQLPVVYTKADGTEVYKVADKFYDNPEGTGADIPANEVITSIASPDGNTKNSPTTLANVKGNLSEVDDAKNNVTNPDGSTVTDATTDKAPTVPADIKKNNAATVGDVLNAGFNLQNNDVAKDFVRHGDTMNFKDGKNTTVSIENTDKKVSNITVDIKDDITLKSVTIADGTNKGPKLSKDGIDMNNTPITNISNGLDKFDATDPKTQGLVNLTKDTTPDSSAATVGDLRNMGWVISSNQTTDAAADTKYNAQVKNANEVEFVGNNLAKVSGKTTDNKRTITVDVKLDKTATDDETITVNDNGELSAVTSDIDTSVTGDLAPETNKGKALVNATTLAKVINNYGFTVKANSENDGFKVTRNAVVDFIAGDTNLNISRTADTGKFTFTVSKTPEFTTVTITGGPVLDSNGLNMNDKPITNITNSLTTYGNTNPKTEGLVDLSNKATTPDSSAATVRDLRNMGWVVSSDKTTTDEIGKPTSEEYSDKVKNANEVRFVGTSLATVSGKTDDKGVHTITVDVNAQNVTNNAQLPVIYTKPTGEKVYKVGDKFYDNPQGNGTALTDDEVGKLITSMVNPKGDTKNAPTTLANVKDNIGLNDKGQPNGYTAGTPLEKIDDQTLNKIGNNAATVNDVMRAGWNAYINTADKTNHKAVVNPTDNVVFKGENGLTVDAVAENNKGTTTFVFKLDEGKVATPEFTIGNQKYQKIGDKYYPVDAQGNPDTANPVTDTALINQLKDAKPDNKTNNVVTGEQVANAIRESGWNLGKATDDELKATTFSDQAQNTEKVNANDNVRFANGKGTVVKTGVFDALDANGLKVTTTTVKIDVDLPIAYEAKDAAGKELVKANDGKWYEKGKVDAETGRVTDKTATGVEKPNTLGVKLTTNDPAETPYTPKTPTEKDAIDKGTGGVALNNVAWAEEPDQAVNKDQLDQTVNKSGFYVKQNGNSTTETADTEKVTPNDVVDFVDGNNTKVTAITKRNDKGVDTTEVKVNVVGLPMQYTKEDGTPVVKVGDKYYPVKEDGTPDLTTALSKDEEGKLSASVVNPTAKPHEKGKPVTLNNIKDNIGVNADGTTVADQTKGNPFAKPTTEDLKKIGNNAATVNDVMRAGWNAYVDSTDKANHKAVVNPTDNVVFKGENGISVTSDGESADGTTIFKFSLKTGEVISTNKEEPYLPNTDGSKTPVTKVGDKYYKTEDLENGVPKANTNPLTEEDVKKVKNTGDKGAGFVTGNQVADAIQANGWTVGKATEDEVAKTKFSSEAGADKVEKINPDDNIRFADGKNTIVSLGTVEAIDKNGVAKTTTTIKVDVDLPIDYKYKDKDGNEVVKGEDGKFYQIDKATGKADKAKPVAEQDQDKVTRDGAKLTDSGDKPSYTVADPIAKAVEDFKQKNPAATEAEIAAEREKAIKANPASKDTVTKGEGGVALNNVAWATNPDQAVNKDQLDQTVNKSGFYVKQNGKSTLAGKDSDKDVDTEKVTPNDVVDFTDGGNTKVVVTTERENGRDVTKVKVNVVGLPMQYTNKDGTPVVKVGDKFVTVDDKGNPTTTEVAAGDLSVNVVNPAAPNKKGDPTKLGNIADGAITPDSKEAVNGGQIFALTGGQPAPKVKNIEIDGKTYKNVVVDENGEPLLVTYNVQGKKEHITNSVISAINNMNKEGIKFFHVNDGRDTAKKPRPEDQRKNEEDSSASGKWAAAIGFAANARAEASIAIGYGATAGAEDKQGNVISGENAVAIGNNAQALGDNTISVGTGNIVAGKNSGAFGDPSYITDKDKDGGAVDGSYSIGNNNVINSSNTFVLGNNVNNKGTKDAEKRPEALGNTVENSVYLGNKTTATAGEGIGTKNIDSEGNEGKTTTAGDKGTVTSANVNGLVYGGFAGDKANGVVSVGAAGSERRIQNVAAGEISATSTDAINGSQLYHVASKLGDISNQMNRNNKQHRAGIAGANAAAALPQVYIPGKSMVAASAGTYKGQSALAVGYSRSSDNGKIILKLQGNANSSGDFGAGVGLGYQW